ncbi:alpha/beta hydrolase family esterase [Actinokineospora sp. HUAS TT18]|uniref:alpha/beta hydrolase family esterase n=1 Tax=Actinokineospora sp. HUAS TT18 TaxID=3447451 RepID=UPI003F5230E0
MARSKVIVALAALAFAAAVAPSSTAVAAEQGCGLTPTGGTVTRTIGFRSYNLRVPAGLTAPAPLMLSIHGLGSFPFGQEFATGWSQYADSHKFIVAYPAGNSNHWNVDRGSPDIAFLKSVVDRISATYCVDPRRVYAEGGSLGSWMSQRLACDAADTFAAVSGTMGGSPTWWGACTPSRPIGVSLFHGESDLLINVGLGKIARDEWAARNSCGPAVVEPVPNGSAQRYDCSAGVKVTWRSYPGLGHAYPSGADGQDFRDRAWAHLSAHTLP